MRKLTALFAVSALALGSASAVFAADTTTLSEAAPSATSVKNAAPVKMMHHKGQDKEGLFSGLNLTEQQRQQMRDIMKESRKNRGAEVRDEHRALHSMVASDNFDEAKAKVQIEVIGKAQSERMLERAKTENKMYNLLTPEQKKQYNENYLKREQKMKEHMNKTKG
ncbi:ATP-independent periplasmic protein-refolding chaperone Spy [Serratia sp. UGAL515B_01]|uniref:ATP-independent periplasmic protein-refolding chaperone Spy n=1 Tax=Serratia sp. UGAL515B_01 TaxID=2986763 RepID=UPI002955C445|nr:ATP-independent periplasmic protein-refolding chaperone Spy [Serratia sp. UGAL515B_01]WON77157.1 ATP-independent periplasmic protein-refolding chaperone Spy [Serratia sp. UGAL515B_01]